MIVVGYCDCKVIVNRLVKLIIKGVKMFYLERFGFWVYVYGFGLYDKFGDVLKLFNDCVIR